MFPLSLAHGMTSSKKALSEALPPARPQSDQGVFQQADLAEIQLNAAHNPWKISMGSGQLGGILRIGVFQETDERRQAEVPVVRGIQVGRGTRGFDDPMQLEVLRAGLLSVPAPSARLHNVGEGMDEADTFGRPKDDERKGSGAGGSRFARMAFARAAGLKAHVAETLDQRTNERVKIVG